MTPDKGDPGDDGADGEGLESLDQFDGLPCTRDGDEGETDLTYDGDGFARLQCVVESEPAACVDGTNNGTPESAFFLGSIRGDEGADIGQIEARLCSGSDWWLVRVTEESSFFDAYLSAKIVVTPTSGDPDVFAYCESTANPIGSSSGLGTEVIAVQNDDDAGLDDGFNLLIEVRGFAVPTEYTLSVVGNQEAPTNNCDP